MWGVGCGVGGGGTCGGLETVEIDVTGVREAALDGLADRDGRRGCRGRRVRRLRPPGALVAEAEALPGHRVVGGELQVHGVRGRGVVRGGRHGAGEAARGNTLDSRGLGVCAAEQVQEVEARLGVERVEMDMGVASPPAARDLPGAGGVVVVAVGEVDDALRLREDGATVAGVAIPVACSAQGLFRFARENRVARAQVLVKRTPMVRTIRPAVGRDGDGVASALRLAEAAHDDEVVARRVLFRTRTFQVCTRKPSGKGASASEAHPHGPARSARCRSRW